MDYFEIEGDLEGLTFNNPESTPEFASLNYYGEMMNHMWCFYQLEKVIESEYFRKTNEKQNPNDPDRALSLAIEKLYKKYVPEGWLNPYKPFKAELQTKLEPGKLHVIEVGEGYETDLQPLSRMLHEKFPHHEFLVVQNGTTARGVYDFMKKRQEDPNLEMLKDLWDQTMELAQQEQLRLNMLEMTDPDKRGRPFWLSPMTFKKVEKEGKKDDG